MDLYNIGSIVRVKSLEEILYLKTNLPSQYYKYCNQVCYIVKIEKCGLNFYYYLNITRDFCWRKDELYLVDECNSFIDLKSFIKF